MARIRHGQLHLIRVVHVSSRVRLARHNAPHLAPHPHMGIEVCGGLTYYYRLLLLNLCALRL
jgi:hypothetical protein